LQEYPHQKLRVAIQQDGFENIAYPQRNQKTHVVVAYILKNLVFVVEGEPTSRKAIVKIRNGKPK
jgi:hypothetical protein